MFKKRFEKVLIVISTLILICDSLSLIQRCIKKFFNKK